MFQRSRAVAAAAGALCLAISLTACNSGESAAPDDLSANRVGAMAEFAAGQQQPPGLSHQE
jgi:hypothetical protein